MFWVFFFKQLEQKQLSFNKRLFYAADFLPLLWIHCGFLIHQSKKWILSNLPVSVNLSLLCRTWLLPKLELIRSSFNVSSSNIRQLELKSCFWKPQYIWGFPWKGSLCPPDLGWLLPPDLAKYSHTSLFSLKNGFSPQNH